MRLWLIRLSITTVVLALLAFIAFRAASKHNASAQAAEQKLPDVRIDPIAVQTVVAQPKQLVQTVSSTGIAEAVRRVQISARISAELLELRAQEGKFFQKGELLFRLNEREYAIALREAKDELIKAQSEYALLKSEYNAVAARVENKDAAKQLLDAKARYESATARYANKEISADDLKAAKEAFELALVFSGNQQDAILRNRTGLTKAENMLERAQLNLEHTRLTAPFAGYAANIKVSEGQVLSVGQPCMEFVDISRIRVETGILEKELPLIRVGNRARLSFNAFPNERIVGEVVSLSPVISTETKTAKAIIEVANPTGKLKPGMYATVETDAQVYQNRLTVPRSAVLERDRRKVVFVKEGNLAKWHYVQTGIENQNEIEITDGINAGDEVIIENNFSLSHDMPVTVLKATANKPTP